MTDFVLRGGTVVHPDRPPERRDVLVQKGKIAALLAPGAAAPAGIAEESAKGLHVFPGLIDAHVHFGFGYCPLPKLTTLYPASSGTRVRWDVLCAHHASTYAALIDQSAVDWNQIPPEFANCIVGVA